MAFKYPWGNLQGLNLTWFINQFNKLREDWATAEAGIDGALDAEIQKAEDALSDVFDARDAAAASATAAAGSATQAGTSATAAQNSATAAASSATLANNKATAAGLSEAAAAQSASQAALSASNAGNAATQAGNSATAAGNSATAAAGSATQAGNSATAAAGSASAAATSETNAAASAQRAEDAAASAQAGTVVKSVENVPIASVDDALPENAVELVVDIAPVQAGTGDPAPDNVRPLTGHTEANVTRAGVNLWDGVWESGDISSTTGQNSINSTQWRTVNYIPISPNTEYYVGSQLSDEQSLRARFYDINKNYIGYSPKSGAVATHRTFVTPDNAYYLRFAPYNSYIPDHDVSINCPASDVDYQTYSGTTIAITFSPLTSAITFIDGKYYNDNGEIVSSPNAKYEEEYLPVFSVLNYVFDYTASSTNNLRVHEYDTNKTWLRQKIASSSIVGNNSVAYTPSPDAAYIRFSIPITATDIDLATTAFGGTLTYANGEWKLRVNKASYEAQDVTWTMSVNTVGLFLTNMSISQPDAISHSNGGRNICSHYRTSTSFGAAGIYQNTGRQCMIRQSVLSTIEEWNTFITAQKNANTPVQIVYDLATPIEYTLTESQAIALLNGINNVYADTGNINLLRYYADSKGYIDAQDALVKALIAKELDDMIADTALTANDFRIVNNTLYRITAPVASGATLTPGTNCTATTVSAVLKTLLS